MITAPFNFVPLSDKVFFPDWAEKANHDIPFEDAQSGVIDITITAKSPIFIRDGKDDEKFCNHNGTYYIPGSSVKGMVRNVLEIMSFSKIKIDEKTHQKILSVRDMTNRRELVGTATGCGFLKEENGKWIIEDYGKPRTIAYTNRREKKIGNGIECNFDTAKEKYEKNGLYRRVSVQCDTKDLKRNDKILGNKRVATLNNSAENAYLILTGGIDNKKNEFVFVDSDKGNKINIDKKVVDEFKKVYFESDSIDGNFWKNNYDPKIGIPVFYQKIGSSITAIGLSQLFKLAYKSTINEATKQILKTIQINNEIFIKLDLSETIFGTVMQSSNQKENFALKGRVQFSHFKCTTNPQEYGRITTVLGSPRSSFYPEYIKQNCNNNGTVASYNTLMKNSAQISGWKRYPLRYGKPNIIPADENTESATTFIPLGTYNGDKFEEFTFKGKVRFHNLKKVELGALISALTFHANQDTFYHNIGMAKSLGFGKIKIDIDTSSYIEHMQLFELEMDNFLKDSWIDTEQLKELFTMSYYKLNIDDKLKYLNLNPENRINEFVDIKKEKKCLPKVSQMFDLADNYPKKLVTEELIREKQQNIQRKLEQEELNQALTKIKETENIQELEAFIQKYPEHEEIQSIKKKIEELKKDRYKLINEKAQHAYDAIMNKKGTKSFAKDRDKFVKKWSAEKNNKNSPTILELVEKIKNMK